MPEILLSDCAPAIDGYGPECNRMGDVHLCGLDESAAEGYLVYLIAELLQRWYGTTGASRYRHARHLIHIIRERDEEEGDGR